MKDMMHKMMASESEGAMDSDSAKLEVLEELRELAMSLMGDKMKGKLGSMAPEMKEVTVAAPSEEGLQKGLQMAQELAPEADEMEDDMELSEIEALIHELEEKRRAKLGQA